MYVLDVSFVYRLYDTPEVVFQIIARVLSSQDMAEQVIDHVSEALHTRLMSCHSTTPAHGRTASNAVNIPHNPVLPPQYSYSFWSTYQLPSHAFSSHSLSVLIYAFLFHCG